MNETLTINDLEFEVRRSTRRKTFGLTVGRSGELVVHAPLQTDVEELRAWVRKKLLWVNRKLLQKEEEVQHVRLMEPVSGETVSYLGRNYRLKRVEEQTHALQFDGQWFTIRIKDCSRAPLLLKTWYRRNGLEWLTPRVKSWERKTDTSPSGVKVEELGYRWASCTRSGVLRFNWKLFQLPVRLIDYVIAHELTHIRVHNHSKAFWNALEQAMPDWKSRKDELDSSEAEILWQRE